MEILRKQSSTGDVCLIGIDECTFDKPGNGGLRIKTYISETEAQQDCRHLTSVMLQKHGVYNTGFSGAKIVVAAESQNIDKERLLPFLGDILQDLGGRVYTGCDLNTTLQDMLYLQKFCPYILAALGTAVDPGIATGYGVIGSIQSVIGTRLHDKKFLVHGIGKVGSTVAQALVALGGTVFTYDLVPERATLAGCINVSDRHDWWAIGCDVLVPCSIGGLITSEIAELLQCRYIVGSANLPLDNSTVLDKLIVNDIVFIPEVISSAGAIICDSVEFYHPDSFHQASPSSIYAFVGSVVHKKTDQFLNLRLNASFSSYDEILAELIVAANSEDMIGNLAAIILDFQRLANQNDIVS